jgi:hypothetical protein
MIFKCIKCGEEAWLDGRDPVIKRKAFFYATCSKSGTKEKFILTKEKREYARKAK